MIVVDTHIFIWYVLDDQNLKPWIRQLMRDSPSDVFLPSICVWEALLLVEKGRIELDAERPGNALKQFVAESGFTEVPLTSEIAVLSRTLEFRHNDPADRFIAATAHFMGAALVTEDRHLKGLPWIKLLN